MPALRQDFNSLIVSFFRDIRVQIYELSYGPRGRALAISALAPFLYAAAAVLIGGAEGRPGEPDSSGSVGNNVALALGGPGSASGLCHM